MPRYKLLHRPIFSTFEAMQTKLKLDNVSFKRGSETLFQNFSWEITEGQNWVITGMSGSGKSTLLEALLGNYFVSEGSVTSCFGDNAEDGIQAIKPYTAFVFFQDREINYDNFYYQQRYNSSEVEGVFTLHDFLQKESADQTQITALVKKMHMGKLLDRAFIKLSNGETRKALLIKALLKNPKLLILDNPYTGLDVSARKMINETIDQLILDGIQVIMVGDQMELPKQINQALRLDNWKIQSANTKTVDSSGIYENSFSFDQPVNDNYEIAVKLSDVVVTYDVPILNHLHWTIRKNEKWTLMGNNGAGKSMLISLIYADNPQAYANEIMLFDSPRGNGESIWDIKERIGFVSPEMHLYVDKHQTCRQAALIGIYSNPYKIIPAEKQPLLLLKELFHYYGIEILLDKPLNKVSSGQQRLILFISTILKNPTLLLLDEPFQGFDPTMIEKSKYLLDQFCANRTLVFVSHKADEIPSCVTRTGRIENGILNDKN
jgi:molybdate transport system ATP-binding protein